MTAELPNGEITITESAQRILKSVEDLAKKGAVGTEQVLALLSEDEDVARFLLSQGIYPKNIQQTIDLLERDGYAFQTPEECPGLYNSLPIERAVSYAQRHAAMYRFSMTTLFLLEGLFIANSSYNNREKNCETVLLEMDVDMGDFYLALIQQTLAESLIESSPSMRKLADAGLNPEQIGNLAFQKVWGSPISEVRGTRDTEE